MNVGNKLEVFSSDRTFACGGWRVDDLISVAPEMTRCDARRFLEEVETDLKRLIESEGSKFIERELRQRGYSSLATGSSVNRLTSALERLQEAMKIRKSELVVRVSVSAIEKKSAREHAEFLETDFRERRVEQQLAGWKRTRDAVDKMIDAHELALSVGQKESDGDKPLPLGYIETEAGITHRSFLNRDSVMTRAGVVERSHLFDFENPTRKDCDSQPAICIVDGEKRFVPVERGEGPTSFSVSVPRGQDASEAVQDFVERFWNREIPTAELQNILGKKVVAKAYDPWRSNLFQPPRFPGYRDRANGGTHSFVVEADGLTYQVTFEWKELFASMNRKKPFTRSCTLPFRKVPLLAWLEQETEGLVLFGDKPFIPDDEASVCYALEFSEDLPNVE